MRLIGVMKIWGEWYNGGQRSHGSVASDSPNRHTDKTTPKANRSMTPHPYGWLSLLPPLVAIVLAIVTRRIVFSLIVGIFAGALLMAGGNPLVAIYHTWETHLWQTLIDPGKLRVFSFTILMGAMVGVITCSGGMRGIIVLIEPYASNRRRGQLATWFMGLLIFFDDYANTMLLGSTLRPVCDRLKISREKLAYLVDSTAAPVAGLAPLSTWVAVEIDYIASGLDSIAAPDGMSAFGLFLASIPYRFYIWSALLLVPISSWLGRDIGPMVAAEQKAAAGDGPADGPADDSGAAAVEGTVADNTESAPSAWSFAAVPILLTLLLVVYFIYDTGSRGACAAAASSAIDAAQAIAGENTGITEQIERLKQVAADGNIALTAASVGELQAAVSATNPIPDDQLTAFEPRLKMRDLLGQADSSLALQYGALAGMLVAFVMPLVSRSVPLADLVQGALAGSRIVLPAVAILWTASAMSKMTTDSSVDGRDSTVPYEFKDHRMYTADYLTTVLTGEDEAGETQARVSVQYLPTVVFLLAAVVAFSTGTSWGTMGILVPMVIQTTDALLSGGSGLSANDPILLCSIGGVLAGAVFGDHCSPISDTTVLSSQSSGCDHLAHVWTQMPYALLAGIVSVLLGTLPLGFGVSVWLLLPLQIASLVVLMRLLGKQTLSPTAESQAT